VRPKRKNILWLLALALCLAACDSAAPVSQPPTPTPSPLPTTAARNERPTQMEGKDSTDTRPFHLDGGTYEAEWEVSLIMDFCQIEAYLYQSEGSASTSPKLIVNESFRPGSRLYGSTLLNDVGSGPHYVRVQVLGPPCNWQITFTPK
jgi:hypothetical protein